MEKNYELTLNGKHALDIARSFYESEGEWGRRMLCHIVDVAHSFEQEDEQVISLLGCLLPFTSCTKEDLLLCGIEEHIIEYLDILYRLDGESFPDYISRISNSPIVAKVKKRDMEITLSANHFFLGAMGGKVPEPTQKALSKAIRQLDSHSL